MPYPTDPDLYPSEFAEIFRRGLDEDLEIKCDSSGQAKNLRHRLHAYRRAVENSRIPGWSELRRVEISVEEHYVRVKPSSLVEALSQFSSTKPEPTDEELAKYLQAMEEPSDEPE